MKSTGAGHGQQPDSEPIKTKKYNQKGRTEKKASKGTKQVGAPVKGDFNISQNTTKTP